MTESKFQPLVMLALFLVLSSSLTDQSSEIHHGHSEEMDQKLGGWHFIDSQNTKQY